MEEHPGTNYENKDISINVFESLQIDFRPVKPKKRRRTDDYDYDDPFLEPFEGEFDVVELECKLENFFVYKGTMEDDPKRIARKYNNSLKKTKLIDVLANMDQGSGAPVPCVSLFEFEKMLAGVFNPSSKYKKESKLENALLWMVLVEDPEDDVEHYLKYKLLSLHDSKKYGPELRHTDPSELEEKLRNLKSEVEDMFRKLLGIANDDRNFSSDKKSFCKFRESEFVELVLDFCIKYVKYYAASTEESLQYIKNRALGYLNAMLPEQCTNKIKLKHYLSKAIYNKIENSDYDLKKVIEGELTYTDPPEVAHQHKKFSLARDLISNGKQLDPTPSDTSATSASSCSPNARWAKKQDFIRRTLLSGFSSKPHQYVHPTKTVFSSTFIKPGLLDNALSRGNQGSVVEEMPKSTSSGSSLPLSSIGAPSLSCSLSLDARDFSKSIDLNTHAKGKKDVSNLDSLSASPENSMISQESARHPVLAISNGSGELNQKTLPLAADGIRTKRKYAKKASKKSSDTGNLPGCQNKSGGDPVSEIDMNSQSQDICARSMIGDIESRTGEIYQQRPEQNQVPSEACMEDDQSPGTNLTVKTKRKYTKRVN